MREIKFRGLNENKVWEYTGETIFMDDFWRLVATGEITNVCQYTGLKDKNGKEIYEGDVVQEDIRRDKRSKPIMRWSVVVYSEKGMFIVECLPKSLRQWNELYKENDQVEVIGNIYENPELIHK